MGGRSNIKKKSNQGNVHDCKQDEEDSSQTKKHRKRTKKLVSQLKKQIEFYFSDSNLQKDRFLKQECTKNPEGYVQIKTIADFNRMKMMTDDIGLVIKAMKSSEILQVNDEKTMVKRVAPLPETKNVDAETVYVECLPPHADHDWLRKIFSQFGKVTYVSIPRFKHTHDIKGFAFIEFENATEASNAVKAFHIETEEKENGQSEDQKPKRRKRSHSESDVDSCKQSAKAERKRRRTTSESSADSQEGNLDSPAKKKQRIVLPEYQPKIKEAPNEGSESLDEGKTRKRKKNDKSVHWKPDDDENESDKQVKHTKIEPAEEERSIKKEKESESESNAENPDLSEEESKKKKHKKRKRKIKEKKEGKLPQFRVIPKLEWMRFKAEYKQLQRESMQNLKKQLQECTDKPGDDTQETKPEKTPQKKQENKEHSTAVKELPFTPGVVLHFKCVDTDLPKSEVRERITTHAPVAYIDIKEGAGEGYVRFHTAENCSTVLDSTSKDASSGLELLKVKGEQEREYWRKINADRVARFQAKREKKRGTEKVARKVDAIQVHQQVSHIRFDDE